MNILFKKLKKGTIISIVLLASLLIGVFILISKESLANAFFKNNQIEDEITKFFRKLDSDMAQALDVDLSDYRKCDDTQNWPDIDLFDVVTQVPKKYGDYYAIYVSKKKDKCKVLKQDLDGVYTLYEFEKENKNASDWKISNEKSIQGEYKFINDYFIENPTPKGIEKGGPIS